MSAARAGAVAAASSKATAANMRKSCKTPSRSRSKRKPSRSGSGTDYELDHLAFELVKVWSPIRLLARPRAPACRAATRHTPGMALRSLHNSCMTLQIIVDTSLFVSEERQRNYGIETRQRPLLAHAAWSRPPSRRAIGKGQMHGECRPLPRDA